MRSSTLKEINHAKLGDSYFYIFYRKRLLRCQSILSLDIMRLVRLKTPKKEAEKEEGLGIKNYYFFLERIKKYSIAINTCSLIEDANYSAIANF